MISEDELRRLETQIYPPYVDRAVQAHLKGARHLQSIATTFESRVGYPVRTYVRKRGKSFARAVRKVERKLESDTSLSIEEAIASVTDIAGGRLLVLYPSDGYEADDTCCEYIERCDDLRLHEGGELEDYMENPKKSGYRGLHRVWDILLESGFWFPIEIQFLTLYQEDWSHKEHTIYEDPERYPPAIKQELRILSDRLHELSVRSDALRWAIEYHSAT